MVARAKTCGELLSWREAERLYTRPPTAREIVEAFPEEVKEVVLRRLRLAERALRAIEELLAPKLLAVPPEDRPAAWLLLKTAWGLDGLEERVRFLRGLLKMAKRPQPQSWVSARELKERVDLREVCRAIGINLKPAGKAWVGHCPFPDHPDLHPSFVVYQRIWRCFGCNRKGDVISLLQELRGLSFGEAIKELRRWA